MRFGHEADRMVQSGIAGRKARRLQKISNALVRACMNRVDVRAGGPAFVVHRAVNRRHHDAAQEACERTAEFVGLGVNQRHGVGVVGAVGRMGIDHHVWIPSAEELVEQSGIEAVALDKVTIQIQVLTVTAKAEGLWAVLVDPTGRPAV